VCALRHADAQLPLTGVACVILDALTRRRWAKEDELAADIMIHPKQLRKTLRYLEEDQLVLRGAVRETPKDVLAVAAAAGRSGDPDAPAPIASRTYVVRAPSRAARPHTPLPAPGAAHTHALPHALP
jgi:hypothetical protein